MDAQPQAGYDDNVRPLVAARPEILWSRWLSRFLCFVFCLLRGSRLPEFGLLFIVNAFFIIHAARTGRLWPWAYVILFLPLVGVGAYIIFEILPQYRYSPDARRAQASVARAVNPEKRYRALKGELEVADTLGNRLSLAEECVALRKYDEALALYDEIIASPQGDEPRYVLGMAQAEVGLERPDAAIATLEELKQRWPSYQSQDGHLLYARALEKVGRDDEAMREYEELSRYFAGQEVQVRRLLLLDRMGHKIEAHQIANEVLRYFKRCPSYARKQQAEWFSAARGYLKSEGVKPS